MLLLLLLLFVYYSVTSIYIISIWSTEKFYIFFFLTLAEYFNIIYTLTIYRYIMFFKRCYFKGFVVVPEMYIYHHFHIIIQINNKLSSCSFPLGRALYIKKYRTWVQKQIIT